ncbi:class I SAM-dependent methyltransferase [Nonomuraea sp. NPDC003201]
MTIELVEHYTKATSEGTRLTRSPHGMLEYRRTQELLRRTLTRPPARILDVGGGTGIHAQWLAMGLPGLLWTSPGNANSISLWTRRSSAPASPSRTL